MDIGRSRPCNVDFMEEIDSVRDMFKLLFKLLGKGRKIYYLFYPLFSSKFYVLLIFYKDSS